jgi:hypothetical protein
VIINVRMVVVVLGLAMGAIAAADELRKVNQPCSDLPCESGLTCVETRDEGKKCATCSQSDLEGYSRAIDDMCKTFGEGWTPSKSEEYQAALAPDGRVRVDVYDTMLDKAKACKQARESREGRCWNGGDDRHKKALNEIGDSISRIADHKGTMIGARRVYYCQTSTYVGRLSTFNSKCQLNFPDMDQKLTIYTKDLNDSKTVPCSDVERYRNDSERCVDAGKDLLYDGFSDSSYKIPEEYSITYGKAREVFKKGKDVYDTAKGRTLCN